MNKKDQKMCGFDVCSYDAIVDVMLVVSFLIPFHMHAQ